MTMTRETEQTCSASTATDDSTIDDSNTENNNTKNTNNSTETPVELTKTWPALPTWAQAHNRQEWGQRLIIHEWEGICNNINDNNNVNSTRNNSDSNSNQKKKQKMSTVEEYRQENGWKGSDLVHSRSSPVRILEYRVQYTDAVNATDTSNTANPINTKLTGIVHFTKAAESHAGYCHGGSMCSIMDDIIGWTGFCVTGTCMPWSGFTVQVNTSLCKPIRVGQVLKLIGTIEKVERRKVSIQATLVDPDNLDEQGHEIIHAKGHGLVIINRGVLND